MLALDLPTDPYWIDLPRGVRVEIRPSPRPLSRQPDVCGSVAGERGCSRRCTEMPERSPARSRPRLSAVALLPRRSAHGQPLGRCSGAGPHPSDHPAACRHPRSGARHDAVHAVARGPASDPVALSLRAGTDAMEAAASAKAAGPGRDPAVPKLVRRS